jgi:hypothetical protein
MTMNIYHVSRKDMSHWDEYMAFVCIAPSEDHARNVHPGQKQPDGCRWFENYQRWASLSHWFKDWSNDGHCFVQNFWPDPADLDVQQIGIAPLSPEDEKFPLGRVVLAAHRQG